MKTTALIIAMLATATAQTNPDPRPDITAWANEATTEQLQEVDGIGPAIAGRIIAGRPYKSSAEVDAVKGIGPVLWDRIEKHVEEVRD